MMRRLCHFLWLPCLVLSTVPILPGRPALQVAHQSTPDTAELLESRDRESHSALKNQGMHARSSEHKNSMQILYEENFFSYAHGWSVYFGPRGIPVDPCNLEPFSSVYHLEGKALSEGRFSNIDTPPPTPSGTWSGLTSPLAESDCSIVGDGSGPPILKCGQRPTVAFAKDPGYGDATIVCNGNVTQHHRAYLAEYTA